MRKNLRKIPADIIVKVGGFDTNLVNVSTVIMVKKSEIANGVYANRKLQIVNDELEIVSSYQPHPTTGRFSKKNVYGYKGLAKRDLPKIQKTYCIGERYPYGNTDADPVSIDITRWVFQRDEYPPADWSIVSELINQEIIGDDTVYTLKVGVDELLDRNSEDFNRQLHFALNMLLENVGAFDVYSSEATLDDYRKTTMVHWEIFPAGSREQVVARITNGMRVASQEQEQNIVERTLFLNSLNPIEYIVGRYLGVHYFGAKFSESLFVFENARYGNAIYVLFDDWRELTKLSRTELLKLPDDKYIRIPHNKYWKSKLRDIVQKYINTNDDA